MCLKFQHGQGASQDFDVSARFLESVYGDSDAMPAVHRFERGSGRLDPRQGPQRLELASATVKAVMLTMRRTVAEGVRMCAGWAAPSSTGPMAMPPPAAVLSRL